MLEGFVTVDSEWRLTSVSRTAADRLGGRPQGLLGADVRELVASAGEFAPAAVLEHVLAALERGLHVFCEKPLCYAPADIDALIAALDAAVAKLEAALQQRAATR